MPLKGVQYLLGEEGRLGTRGGLGQKGPSLELLAWKQGDRSASNRRAGGPPQASKPDAATERELVEPLATVAFHPCWEHASLPSQGRNLEPGELLDDFGNTLGTLELVLVVDVLPTGEESQELGCADRFDLATKA